MNPYDEIQHAIGKCLLGFSEGVVVDLTQAMGYGGFWRHAVEITGKSGGEGIDEITKEDKLGLDVIPPHARRWNKGIVSESEIQNFIRDLHGKGARKGIFITTSKFSESANRYADGLRDLKVMLIDDEMLARLMLTQSHSDRTCLLQS